MKKLIVKLLLVTVILGLFSTSTFADEVEVDNITETATVQPKASDPGDGRPKY